VYRRLVEDEAQDYYLVMEDDIYFLPDSKALMTASLRQAPANWDVICGVYHRAEDEDVHAESRGGKAPFAKVGGFWGLGGYVVSRDGAAKILREVEARKIDGQIDAYMSRMAQQGKLDVYAAKKQWFRIEPGGASNIQTHRVVPLSGQDPFEFDGFKV
jgi:GR25 family glycosyltransferase involved in LPS biosynthesis